MTPKNLTKWKRPSSYFGEEWTEYYVFLSQHRDSDALTRANFDTGWRAVKAVASKDDEDSTIIKVSENHWAVGWVEWIAIHHSDTAALTRADELAGRLLDYPVLDEELFSQYETDEANEVWRNCFRPKERVEYIRKNKSQFYFHDYRDMIGCVRGKYFAGYASELLN